MCWFVTGELCIDFAEIAKKISTGVGSAKETVKGVRHKAVEVNQELGLGLNMESLASALNFGTRSFVALGILTRAA